MAQFQDSLNLDPVLISASRNDELLSEEYIEKDKKTVQFLSYNLGEILAQNKGIYIKTYGPSHSSTPSIRGASGNQTEVLWNGLPIVSPTLGLQDLSLTPFNFFKASTLSKSSVSGNGNQAIGGSIDLRSEFEDYKASVDLAMGQYGVLDVGAAFNLKKNKIQGQTKIIASKATNDFSYDPDGLNRQQTNAATNQIQVLQNLKYRLSSKMSLGIDYWFLTADREIPPTLAQTSSEAKQEDLSHRIILQSRFTGKKITLNTSLGYFLDEQLFQDVNLISNIKTGNGYFRAIYTHDINNELQFNYSSRVQSIQVFPVNEALDGYQEWRQLNDVALRYKKKNFSGRLGIKKEFLKNQKIPLAPSLQVEKQISKLKLKYLLAYNYRIPSINDRFWKPGGNPDLVPEQGWSQELMMHLNFHDFIFSVTGFNRKIDQWILWSPSSDKPWWEANNISKVWSRGLETSLDFTKKLNKIALVSAIAYQHIRSTSEFDLELPRIAKGEQLIYTPAHQAQGSISINTKSQTIRYSHSFMGKSTGINEEIKAYQLGNLFMSHEQDFGIPVTIFFNINNLFNHQYVIIERRPMPGRLVKIGLQLKLN